MVITDLYSSKVGSKIDNLAFSASAANLVCSASLFNLSASLAAILAASLSDASLSNLAASTAANLAASPICPLGPSELNLPLILLQSS